MSPDWIDHVNADRAEELKRVLRNHKSCFEGKDLLEIGSGTGLQLKILSSICRSSFGLELPSSGYREHRIAEVREYDGKSIPFSDASFDIIFSSHVLQYLICERELYGEMRRVLRPGGVAVHVLPTSSWRVWSSLLHYPAKVQLLLMRYPRAVAAIRAGSEPRNKRHTPKWWGQVLLNILFLHRLGARGNWFTEHFIFRRRAWRRRLASYGWVVERIDPVGLWYSGHRMVGPSLSTERRSTLARILGSSAMMILARPRTDFSETTR